jgi:ABC-2 type transport system permease protein
MNGWKYHFVKELRRILTDKRIAITMLAGPFLYAFLFGGVYLSGRIRQVPIVIVDQDQSMLSRDLTEALLAGENLSLAFYAASPADFYRAAKRNRAYACVVIPEDFQKDVVRGTGGRITVILDGSNILIGNMTSRAIAGTITAYRVAARARRLMATGTPRSQAMAAALPIQPVVRSLFNPASHYGVFMLIGLVAVALQQMTRMGAALALSLGPESENWNKGDRQSRRKRTFRFSTAGLQGRMLAARRKIEISLLSAKVAATAALVLPVAFVAVRLPFDIFGSPFRGSWLVAYGVLVLFISMQILIGYGIAGICRSALLSLQVLLFASVPLFTLTGFAWPGDAMPGWLQAISWLIPLTHLLEIFRKMALMGAGPSQLWPHLAILVAWVPISLIWACLSMPKNRETGEVPVSRRN